MRNTALANKLAITSKKSEIDYKVSRDLCEKQSEEYANRFRSDIS